MKKTFIFRAFVGFVLGLFSGYVIPLLLIFVFNLSKGVAVNKDGELFQLPALIVLVLFLLVMFFMLKRLLKHSGKLMLLFVFMLAFATSGFVHNYWNLLL